MLGAQRGDGVTSSFDRMKGVLERGRKASAGRKAAIR